MIYLAKKILVHQKYAINFSAKYCDISVVMVGRAIAIERQYIKEAKRLWATTNTLSQNWISRLYEEQRD